MSGKVLATGLTNRRMSHTWALPTARSCGFPNSMGSSFLPLSRWAGGLEAWVKHIGAGFLWRWASSLFLSLNLFFFFFFFLRRQISRCPNLCSCLSSCFWYSNYFWSFSADNSNFCSTLPFAYFPYHHLEDFFPYPLYVSICFCRTLPNQLAHTSPLGEVTSNYTSS